MKLFSQNSNLYDHDTSTLQTDRQMEGRTTCHGNTALRVASRGKNESVTSVNGYEGPWLRWPLAMGGRNQKNTQGCKPPLSFVKRQFSYFYQIAVFEDILNHF